MSWWLPAARVLNRMGVPYPLMNFIISGTSNDLAEVKFEVTDRCNLTCSFCHQDFGAKGGTEALDRETYERVLATAKADKISTVRITGGEPLLLKSTDDFLRRAKELGFRTIVNTNGTALTEKRLRGLHGLVDCFKISLPAADEETMSRETGNCTTWRRKWEALDRLEKCGFRTEILTVMTAENIRQFDKFIELLEPRTTIRWQPLRAETQEGGPHPATRQDIRTLAARILEVRKRDRWKELTLGLATPFCALENPYDAVGLFHGGATCGPVSSLSVAPDGHALRCYSRRDPIDISGGLRKANRALATADFDRLPRVCRHCPLSPLCRGGCLCEWALEDTPFGRMDYLADPARIPGSEAFAVAGRSESAPPARALEDATSL
ncbi:MAG TPA: radical SAM protein [Xanthobacteraceae bacterium]